MYTGSMVALVTPMKDNGDVDYVALKGLVEFHIANGTTAIIIMGTTGEASTLDSDEHCEVIRKAVEFVAGRIPVIAGTGANDTKEAIDLTRCAKEAGVDACLLVTPYYNKPTQKGLYLHYKAIAEAVDIPQILYNVPGRTAVDLLPETVARLIADEECPNIIGIKDATGDLKRLAEMQELCGDEFALYSGDDATGCEFMLRGGHGVISVTTNVAPKDMSEMCTAALAGDRKGAEAINAKLDPLHDCLFSESNPIPVKWALAEMGMILSGIRSPLTWLSEKYHEALRAAMIHAGILP